MCSTPLRPAAEFQSRMESLARRVKDLILEQPALELLGYLWSQKLLHAMAKDECERGGDELNDDDSEVAAQSVLVALEYFHAVHSCFVATIPVDTVFDEEKAVELLDACAELREATMWYCMASTAPSADGPFGPATAEVEFSAKNAWAFIRGNRYQVLEGEFFGFVLAPHDAALRSVYGVGATEVAAGIQCIANAMRTGFADAAERLEEGMAAFDTAMNELRLSPDKAIAHLHAEAHPALARATQAMRDLLWGGVCDLSAHTNLPACLLDDLAYEPGSNNEFYAPGDFCGTPMRTVPARIKPLIKLKGGYFATDPYFVRDAAYRAIQRGLLVRAPEYRQEWNRRQQQMSERAMEQILAAQTQGATVLHEIYYPAADSGEWVENDTLILLDDVLVQVEAKAGVAAMHSPATDFPRHAQKVRDLVLKAYHQTKRFLEYAQSAPVVPLYQRRESGFEEIMRLELGRYRCVFPIGLTVESFAPFSSICKEIPEVEPILGRYAFISMSIDDLFIIRRLLPTAGGLFHYLEVRQSVAGIRNAFIFDEIDHLGSYVLKNRFDRDIKEQLKDGADRITWDGFSKVIDDYFMSDRWKEEPPPSQPMPNELARILAALEHQRPTGWLKAQSLIRDLGSEGRDRIAGLLRELVASLSTYPRRWFMSPEPPSLMFWLTREAELQPSSLPEQAKAECLKLGISTVNVIHLSFDSDLQRFEIAYHCVRFTFTH